MVLEIEVNRNLIWIIKWLVWGFIGYGIDWDFIVILIVEIRVKDFFVLVGVYI